MSINLENNEIKAEAFELPGRGFLPEEVVLLDYSCQYKTDNNNQKTDTIECIRYTCIDTKTFSRFKVKVLSNKPVISKKDLEDSETPVYIRIPVDETTIKPYEIQYGKAKVSIIAPFVELVKTPKA